MTSRPSHPPTLLRIVERTVREERLVKSGDRIVVAVSGGPDSMAMAHALWLLRERMGLEPIAVGVDHQLRPEAASELDAASAFLGGIGMVFERAKVEVGRGGNLMARAREARYGVLRDAMRRLGASSLAVGHQADDRAETVMIRLLQGSGPAGLAVLPARSGDVIRPLIRARRADVIAHLGRHGVPFSQDPTNESRDRLRGAVRWELLPRMEKLSPRVVWHLWELAEDLGAIAGDGEGRPVLKRAQWKALAKAGAAGGAVRVALPGGRVARVDARSGVISYEGEDSSAVPPAEPRKK